MPAVKIVTANKHGDVPEFFSEVYNTCAWDESGLDYAIVKDNYFSRPDAVLCSGRARPASWSGQFPPMAGVLGEALTSPKWATSALSIQELPLKQSLSGSSWIGYPEK